MLKEEIFEERDYDEEIKATFQFCQKAKSELERIEEEVIHQDRNLIFEYWNLK